ncbi:MAG: hypothetical protein QNK04_19680 [Myxococcota bacterium]|nr:hypothetical protein [Myxococcota bacterium]
MSDAIVLDPRFCGPPGWGHGGVLAGLLAERLGGVVEVTLRKPIPMARPLVLRGADRLVLSDPEEGDALVAEARRSAIEDAPAASPGVDLEDARSLARPEPIDEQGRCFACGASRAEGDGLRLVPYAVGAGDRVAARWDVAPGLPEAEGCVTAAMVWAALDCPGLFAHRPREPELRGLLGRITGEVRTRPRPGDTCVVAAWPLGADGRKRFTGTALYDRAGTLMAQARAVWFSV